MPMFRLSAMLSKLKPLAYACYWGASCRWRPLGNFPRRIIGQTWRRETPRLLLTATRQGPCIPTPQSPARVEPGGGGEGQARARERGP
eukprot:6590802-Pyramimonas_sp.AAC.1